MGKINFILVQILIRESLVAIQMCVSGNADKKMAELRLLFCQRGDVKTH